MEAWVDVDAWGPSSRSRTLTINAVWNLVKSLENKNIWIFHCPLWATCINSRLTVIVILIGRILAAGFKQIKIIKDSWLMWTISSELARQSWQWETRICSALWIRMCSVITSSSSSSSSSCRTVKSVWTKWWAIYKLLKTNRIDEILRDA